ncbi:hypothetical protein, partial [Polaribacter reichenbachii]
MKKITISTYLLLLNFFLLNSQSKINEKNSYLLFDEALGLNNTELYNGIIYRNNLKKTSINTRFYNSENFQLANIKYNNNWFYNIETKYDLYSQKVIVKLSYLNEGHIVIELFSNSIEEFNINNKKFIRTKDFTFWEIVLENNNLNIYRKHKKNKKETIVDNKLYDNFKTVGPNLIVSYKNKLHEVKKEKDILKIFGNDKFLKKIFKENKSIKKTNKQDFYIECIKNINDLLLN